MNKIKEYKIVRGTSTQVEVMVSKFLNDGWQPFGPPMISDHKENSIPVLHQAMVKYDKD